MENGLRVIENKHQERWKNQWWVTSDEQLPHMWMKWTHAWRGMWWTKKQLIISNSRRIAQKHGNANSEAASDTFSAIVLFWRFFSLKTLYLFCSKKQKNTLHGGHICKHLYSSQICESYSWKKSEPIQRNTLTFIQISLW